MKNTLTVFALFVMLSLLGTAVLAVNGSLNLKCEDVTVDLTKDSTFKVEVSSTGTLAYTTGIVDVEFDENVFELTNIVFNDDLAPNNATHLLEDEAVDISNLTEYFAGSSEGTPVLSADGIFTVSFGDDLKDENYTKAGVLFTLTFKVIDDNASGPYTIGLKEVESSYLDKDMDFVTVSLEGGSISKASETAFTVNILNKTKGGAKITIEEEVGNVDASFTVSAGDETVLTVESKDYACSVITTTDDQTYSKVPAQATGEEGVYTFEITVTDGMKIFIVKKGDLNNDGSVTNTDLQMTIRNVRNKSKNPLTDYQVLSVDMNGDEKVTNTDVQSLTRYLRNKIKNPIQIW